MCSATDPQAVWDSRYARMRRRAVQPGPDSWLDRWTGVLPARGESVLELGCGPGFDSRALDQYGVSAIATDFSREALLTARQIGTPAKFLQADIREGLPFQPEFCRLVVASLVLHYFRWEDTVSIVKDIRRCLVPEGRLLARVNSVEDVNFGSRGYPEVEPGMFLVRGIPKRFFDRADVERLFVSGWRLLELQELTTARYEREKRLWEVLVERDAGA